jgi:ATP-dependent RNA helicase DHR2
MGTPLGSSSPSSKVGYSVRFDTSTSPSTRIKFLTEGMLLQEMLRDPWLRNYNAVIVDEVHERSVNVDLILGFLRNIVTGNKSGRKGKPLKVVVMSATADVESLYNFFSRGFDRASLDQNTASIETSDHPEQWEGIQSSEDELDTNENDSRVLDVGSQEENSHDRISTCYIKGRQFPVKTTYLPEPTQDFVEAALKAIFQIHYKEPLPGDVLVFLTGQDTVESLERLVKEYADAMGPEVPKVILTIKASTQKVDRLADTLFTPVCSFTTGFTAESLCAPTPKNSKSYFVYEYCRDFGHCVWSPLRCR